MESPLAECLTGAPRWRLTQSADRALQGSTQDGYCVHGPHLLLIYNEHGNDLIPGRGGPPIIEPVTVAPQRCRAPSRQHVESDLWADTRQDRTRLSDGYVRRAAEPVEPLPDGPGKAALRHDRMSGVVVVCRCCREERAMSVEVVPATSAHWDDVAAIFTGRNGPNACWCQRFRHHDYKNNQLA